MGWESSDLFRFGLGSLVKGQTRTATLKIAYNSGIIGPRVLGWETNLQEIMGWKSSDVRFYLLPFPLGQTRIAKFKSAYNSLIIGPRVLGC